MATWLAVAGVTTAVDSTSYTDMVERPSRGAMAGLTCISRRAVTARFVVTGITTIHDTGVIHSGVSERGRIMTVLAHIRRLNVISRFTDRITVIVTTYTVTREIGVIHLRISE